MEKYFLSGQSQAWLLLKYEPGKYDKYEPEEYDKYEPEEYGED